MHLVFLFLRRQEIDEYINQAKEKGCSVVLELGSKGVNYATNVIMKTALKVGQVSERCAAHLLTNRFYYIHSENKKNTCK